jgi:hypothetical protein
MVGGRPLNYALDARQVTWPTSYHEYRFDGDQSVELLEDRVVVKGKRVFGPEYELTSQLSSLDPVPNRIRVRPTGFWQGIFLAVTCLLLTRVPFFAAEGTSHAGLLWVLAFSFLLLSIVTLRKIDWVQYKTTSGTVAFNIAKAGKRGGNFDRFVDHLSRRIVESGAATPAGTAGDGAAGV